MKKARHDNEASTKTNQVALTNECTEFDSKIQTMAMSFKEHFLETKKQGEQKQAKAKACIAEAKNVYINAQKQMISKYKNIHKVIAATCIDYKDILEHHHKLCMQLQQCEAHSCNQSSALAQVMMSMYQSLANGMQLQPLNLAIIAHLTPDIDMDIKALGNGAPGDTAKHNSTNLNGGG